MALPLSYTRTPPARASVTRRPPRRAPSACSSFGTRPSLFLLPCFRSLDLFCSPLSRLLCLVPSHIHAYLLSLCPFTAIHRTVARPTLAPLFFLSLLAPSTDPHLAQHTMIPSCTIFFHDPIPSSSPSPRPCFSLLLSSCDLLAHRAPPSSCVLLLAYPFALPPSRRSPCDPMVLSAKHR